MRTHLEFRSANLLTRDDEAVPYGKPVAEILAAKLPAYGYKVERVIRDDWGWVVRVVNPSFPLWIGCGHYEEYPDGHLCIIEPSRSFVRHYLKPVFTAEIVERLATSLEKIVRDSGQATNLRWWTDIEVAAG